MTTGQLVLIIVLVIVAAILVALILRRGSQRREEQRVEAEGLRSEAQGVADNMIRPITKLYAAASQKKPRHRREGVALMDLRPPRRVTHRSTRIRFACPVPV